MPIFVTTLPFLSILLKHYSKANTLTPVAIVKIFLGDIHNICIATLHSSYCSDFEQVLCLICYQWNHVV